MDNLLRERRGCCCLPLRTGCLVLAYFNAFVSAGVLVATAELKADEDVAVQELYSYAMRHYARETAELLADGLPYALTVGNGFIIVWLRLGFTHAPL